MVHSSTNEAGSHSLVNKSSTCHGTQKFLTVFTRAHHWILSWDT